MKALLLVLFVPVLAFGQVAMNMEKNPVKISHQSPETNSIDVKNGYVTDARYELVYNSSSGEESFFDFVIYTYSYRDVLQPSDDSALFTVDGLGKIFNILRWTSRHEPERVISSIVIRLSKEELKSISYAAAVGVKIGSNSFTISHMARHGMRQMIAQVELHTNGNRGFYNSNTTVIRVFRSDTNEKSLTARLREQIDH